MLTNLLLIIAYFLLAWFDAWYTAYKLPQTGLTAEWNPTIRYLCRRFGLKPGIYAGVLLPTLVILSFGFAFPKTLIFLLGSRTTLAAFQLKAYKDAPIGTAKRTIS